MTKANTTIHREVIQQAAKRAGINASIGRTEKGGTYHPDKNALGRSVPIEWLENFAREIVASIANADHEREKDSCAHCDGTGDVHDTEGEWRGSCTCKSETK